MSRGVEGSRVRWWVVGAFTPEPTGRRFAVAPDTYAEELARAAVGLRVSVPERLGAGEAREVELTLPKLRSFQLEEVVAAVPELRALRALADGLDKLPPEAAEESIEAVVGRGRLSVAVGAALREKAAAVEVSRAPTGGNGVPKAVAPSARKEPDLVDAIFAKTETARPEQLAKAGVDAFLRAMGTRSTKPVVAAEVTAPAKALVEEAVLATARDVLAAPGVARLESAWRGLKLLVEQCPGASGMAVEVLDVEGGVVEAVERELPEERFERPDALFVVEEVGEVGVLERLADLGERMQLPVVASVSASLFEEAMEEDGEEPEGWEDLRGRECARWLSVVTNRVVVMAEGKGEWRRTSLAGAAWGVAAMLAASFRETGGFARVTGRPGGVQAPAVWELPEGRDAGTAVPTEAFYAMRVQSRLAELGVVGLGSGRNTDVLQLLAVPTVYGGGDKVPLSAQVMTGRLVRFAQWVCEQVAPGAGGEEVARLFTEAADVFLFGGAVPGGRMRGELVEQGEGRKGVRVSAVVKPEHAGLLLELGFTLPLRS